MGSTQSHLQQDQKPFPKSKKKSATTFAPLGAPLAFPTSQPGGVGGGGLVELEPLDAAALRGHVLGVQVEGRRRRGRRRQGALNHLVLTVAGKVSSQI